MLDLKGTYAEVAFSRVVDGDTIRVVLPGETSDESLRILCLDTEESNGGGTKPVTPWGHKAKERAETFFEDAGSVVIEFPGREDLQTCIRKYRGNYGRLLVYVYRGELDFQETMIREGYSPYFIKYGRAQFAAHDQRYAAAEQQAQRERLGVWNQEQVNGSERRNYAALGCWWHLRAQVIEAYRRLRSVDNSILNPRQDYDRLRQKAEDEAMVTIFTEMRTITRVGGHSGLIGMGAIDRPFNLFLPDMDSAAGQAVVNLLETRYISSDEAHPRRSYAYVTGRLSLYRDRPQLVVRSFEQISDRVNSRDDIASPNLVIAALLPDPEGSDAGFEGVALRNAGRRTASLEGWRLQDRGGHNLTLSGRIDPGTDLEIRLDRGQLPLNNTGDDVYLLEPGGKVVHQVAYTAADVVSGQRIWFI